VDTDIKYDSPETDGYNALGPTEARTLAGNPDDNDGVIFDEAFIANSDGATLGPNDVEAITSDEDLDVNGDESGWSWESQGPRPTTRIITGTTVLAGTGANSATGILGMPIQILPADPNRIHLRFRTTAGAPDVRWSDELQTCYGAGMMSDTDQPVTIDGHTGALWILPKDDSSTAYIHYWAVTKNV